MTQWAARHEDVVGKHKYSPPVPLRTPSTRPVERVHQVEEEKGSFLRPVVTRKQETKTEINEGGGKS